VSNKEKKKPNGGSHVPKTIEVGGTGTAQRGRWLKGSGTTTTLKSGWQASLSAYLEKSAVKFCSQAEMNAFIDLLWNDQDLKGMPHVPVGDNTNPQIVREVLDYGGSGSKDSLSK
jgi:hypothetical protein